MRATAALLPVLCSVALASSPPNAAAPAAGGAGGAGAGVWLAVAADRPRGGAAAGPLLPVHLPLKIGTCAAPPAPPAVPALRPHADTHEDTRSLGARTRLHTVHAKYSVRDDINYEQMQLDPPNLPPPSPNQFPLQTSHEMTTLATENADRVPWVFSPSPFFPDGKVPIPVAISHAQEAKAQEYTSFEHAPAVTDEPARGNGDRVPWVFSPSPFDRRRRAKAPASVSVDAPTEPPRAAEERPELPVAVNYLKGNEAGTFFRGSGANRPPSSSSRPAAPEVIPLGYDDPDNAGAPGSGSGQD